MTHNKLLHNEAIYAVKNNKNTKLYLTATTTTKTLIHQYTHISSKSRILWWGFDKRWSGCLYSNDNLHAVHCGMSDVH